MLELIETHKDRVRELLSKYPQARDDDTVLYFMFAREYTNLMGFRVESPGQFANRVLRSEMPPSETLSRCRRKIQNEEGLYHGSRQAKRKAAAEEVKQNIAKV